MLRDQLATDLKSAMKSQNKAEITGLRNLLGKLKAEQIDKGEDLTDIECIKILNSAAKQLKDSIEQYSNAKKPIEVTVSGIVTLAMALQPEKAQSPMEVIGFPL